MLSPLQSSRYHHGGSTFVLPILQSYSYLDLTPINIELDLKGALSSQNIRIDAPASITIGVSTDPEVMQNAATRLLGRSLDEIQPLAGEIIMGQMRVVFASMTINENYVIQKQAEAEGTRALLDAKAQGFEKLLKVADAPSDATQLLIAENIVRIAEIQAGAIKGLQFEKVVVMGDGANGNGGAGQFVQDLYKDALPLNELARNVGLNLPAFLGTPVTPGDSADGNGKTNADAPRSQIVSRGRLLAA